MNNTSETSSTSIKHVFQPSLWRMCATTGVFFIIISIATVYIVKNPNLGFGQYLIYVALAECFNVGFWALILKNFRVDVDAVGIGGMNIRNTGGGRGEYNRIAWADIEKVNTLWYPGYTYLRVYSRKSNHVIGICLVLTDMAGFYAYIRQFANVNNPLRTYLEQRFKNKAL